jgi:iron complex outermembrane receptor protein
MPPAASDGRIAEGSELEKGTIFSVAMPMAGSDSRERLMRILTILLILTAFLFPWPVPAAWAGELVTGQNGDEGLSAEGLLFLEIPMVFAASRKEQPVTEAPAAVTVISAEEIRQSGARTIPDLLQFVSGVDVMTISARDQQVGIRGFNRPLNNKLLVLIDGRSVYSDVFGNVFWSLFPIPMEEIARIEVIKSPISSLHGANAFSGVINILTKSPGELKGTQVNLSQGTLDTSVVSLLHGGESGKVSYKLSAEFDRTDQWDGDDRAGDIARGNFSLGYAIGPEQSISLSGGRVHFKDLDFFTYESAGTARQEGNFDYLQGDYQHGGLKLRVFRKTEESDQQFTRTGVSNDWQVVTIDTEAQYAFDAGNNHSIVTGLSYRRITVEDNNLIDGTHAQNHYALFLEDEIRLGEKLRLIAGGRYDHHPLVKGHFSPRGTLLYTPASDHTIRLSVAKAYRNPSLLESYWETMIPIGPLTLVGRGNRDLDSEGITSFEAGYQTTFLKRTTLGVNLFYNEYSDQIYGGGTVDFPNRIINASFVNGGDAWGVGGELDLNVRVTAWLSLFANYSYQRITDKEDNPFTLMVNEQDRVRHDIPAHKVNAGTRMKFANGLSTNLFLHWSDSSERLIGDLTGNEYLVRTDPYIIFNTRLGYLFWQDRAEASLYVYNLLNDRHFEYPAGINLPDASSDPVGRKILLKLNYRF